MALINSDVVPASATGGYEIEQSLRFNDNDSAYLSWTPSSAGDRKTWTWSGWFKRGNLGVEMSLFSVDGSDDTTYGDIDIRTGDTLHISGYNTVWRITTQVFRDTSAWYHIVVAWDTTQSTASDRVKLYVNGEQITDFSTSNNPSQNTDYAFNRVSPHYLSSINSGASWHLDGYLAEVNFIDGQALDASYFGETDETYGHWKPIEYTGTYGTNGFYLPFQYNPTFGSSSVSTNDIFGDSSIVATYQLNSNANDLGGNYDGTWSGTASYSSGKFSNAASFNNTSITTSITLQNGYTISGWVKDTNTTVQSNNYSGWCTPVYCHISTSDYYIYAPNGTRYQFSIPKSSANVWVHWVIVFNSSGVPTVYKDKVQYTGVSENTSNTTAFNIGSNEANGANFIGLIDQVRVFDKALVYDEVQALYLEQEISGYEFYADSSGNNNDFTATNLLGTDVVLDSPTNNFCTFNAVLDTASKFNLQQGNLRASVSSSNSGGMHGTIAAYSGKWYWEIVYVSGTKWSAGAWNVVPNDLNDDNTLGANNGIVIRPEVGRIYDLVGGSAYQTVSFSTSDTGSIIGVALDLDNGSCQFYKDGSTIGNAVSISSANIARGWTVGVADYSSTGSATFDINCGQDSSFAGTKTAQGNTDSNNIGDFYYTPPSGYLALCTANLPDPAVIPSENFDIKLYSGTSGTQTITFDTLTALDFLWVKKRSAIASHPIQDRVRGDNYYLYTDTTNAEMDWSGYTPSFNTAGFTLYNDPGIWNDSGTYVAWGWKANGSGSSNTNGTITSTVSANQDAGFSIVSYTGNSTAGATVGHGLSSAPEFIIIKTRDLNNSWVAWHTSLGFTGDTYLGYSEYYMLVLDSTIAKANFSEDTVYDVTSSHFRIGTSGSMNQVNNSSSDYIAYCFHSVDGFSKVGSYTGNGSTDGTFVYTGFRPAFVMRKQTSNSGLWIIQDDARDSYNPATKVLTAESSAVEESPYHHFDMCSNGFKVRSTQDDTNGNGQTFIYIAFAEVPFSVGGGIAR